MRFLPHIALVIALTLAGLFLYKLGRSNAAIVCEKGKTVNAISGAKEMVKSTKQRDEVDDQTRKIPDTALDTELHAFGVLRD